MNIESFRAYCLSMKGVTEEFPFDKHTLVFKVMGKMFALTDLESFSSINLKVDPEECAALREAYDYVLPAYHMNKKHWISVVMKGSVPEKLVRNWVARSYDLVVAGLTKSQKLTLNSL